MLTPIKKKRKAIARAIRGNGSQSTTLPGNTERSSHVMESGEGEGKHKYQVNPTIFPNKPGEKWTVPDTSKDKNAAYKEAIKRGEVFGFKRKKRAEKFAQGSWKKGVDKKEAMSDYRKNKRLSRTLNRIK